MEHQPTVIAVSIPLSIILAVIWVVRHRKRGGSRGSASPASELADSYTSTQMLGIVGIVLVLLPVLLAVSFNLARGAMILGAFLLRLLPLPYSVELVLWIITVTAALTMAFSTTYYLVEMVWPKKGATPVDGA